MKNERKRTWTVENAMELVGKVKRGKAMRGLKYCSAVSYLRNHSKKAIEIHA